MKISTLWAVSASLLLAAVLATMSLRLYRSDRLSERADRFPVLTEAGVPLASLFYGVPRLATIKSIATAKTPSTPNCGGVLNKLKAAFQLRTVHASFCQPGGCFGSYFVDNFLYCGGGACSDGTYDFPQSSGDGDPTSGYEYPGGVDCFGCGCLQQTCIN